MTELLERRAESHEVASARSASGAPGAPVRVLYIAGSGRSGTTIIDNILGQLPGVFSAGELRFLWTRGMVENRLCGCGEKFADCPTWSEVMGRALASWPELEPATYAADQHARVRAARLPRTLLRSRRRAAAGAHETANVTDEHVAVLGDLYRSIAHITGAEVLVDSSKLPPYGHLLASVPGVDVRVLHIVRDPRATAFSWLRRKALPDFGDARIMQRQHPAKAATLWLLWNGVTELLWARPGRNGHSEETYLRMRYEDFVTAPEEATARIARFLGVPDDRLPFPKPRTALLSTTHTVAGNPSRHQRGEVALRPDAEWRTAMRARDARLVTALTWPLLLRYRYPLRRTTGGHPRGSR